MVVCLNVRHCHGPHSLWRDVMLFAHKCLYAISLVAFSCSCAMHQTALARAEGKSGDRGAVEMTSHLGSYMAGRLARSMNDTSQAVLFYRQALKSSPHDPRILGRTFLSEATHGNFAEADAIARRLVIIRPDNRLVQLWLGVAEFRSERFHAAAGHFELAGQDPISELTAQLARAWVAFARKQQRHALSLLLPSPYGGWSAGYIQYHRALIADLSQRSTEARKIFSEIFAIDAVTARTTAAYIRHAIHSGRYTLAGQIARKHMRVRAKADGGHASVIALLNDVKTRNRTQRMIETPREGLAEVFYGLGEALIKEGSLELGTVYLQMALSLKPDFPYAQAVLANAHEATKNYRRAIAIYDRIRDGTPLEMEIAIRKANNLEALNETDRAKQILDSTIASYPGEIRPLEAMGNMLYGSKRYREAIDYYSRIIRMVRKPEVHHSRYWYFRGMSYEKIGQWPKAEKDLLRALEMNPDEAVILNHLGYSWVDRNINLHRGLELIEKANKLEPDDWHIVDSLGWAHYRLGNFEEAVSYLEDAVELMPKDPVLNDHLGDALWQVHRRREARYQWELALSLKPDEKEAAKIRKKLVSGLPRQVNVKTSEQQGEHALQSITISRQADNQIGHD